MTGDILTSGSILARMGPASFSYQEIRDWLVKDWSIGDEFRNNKKIRGSVPKRKWNWLDLLWLFTRFSEVLRYDKTLLLVTKCSLRKYGVVVVSEGWYVSEKALIVVQPILLLCVCHVWRCPTCDISSLIHLSYGLGILEAQFLIQSVSSASFPETQ